MCSTLIKFIFITEKQKDLARVLVQELKAMGVEDAHLDQHGYVYATIPANKYPKRIDGPAILIALADPKNNPTPIVEPKAIKRICLTLRCRFKPCSFFSKENSFLMTMAQRHRMKV